MINKKMIWFFNQKKRIFGNKAVLSATDLFFFGDIMASFLLRTVELYNPKNLFDFVKRILVHRISSQIPATLHFGGTFFTKNRKKMKNKKCINIESIQIGLASPDKIREWSERILPNGEKVGQVINHETVDHKNLKPKKGGLFL
eukprot:TRINITY_DN2254_c0_g1_i8.p3 TRINITY_DN2254_c0_g1~~TRINITY_DN2254_c0_g1_i8.p3  ORF type:complete len:144 (+),score=12.88 TRINITY_DN2254_c0_g1_i8:852-1283(+)